MTLYPVSSSLVLSLFSDFCILSPIYCTLYPVPLTLLVHSPSPFPSFSMSSLFLLCRFLLRRTARFRNGCAAYCRRGLRSGLRREGGLQGIKIAERDPERFGVVIGGHDVEDLLCMRKEDVPRADLSDENRSRRRPADQIIATIAVFVHI